MQIDLLVFESDLAEMTRHAERMGLDLTARLLRMAALEVRLEVTDRNERTRLHS